MSVWVYAVAAVVGGWLVMKFLEGGEAPPSGEVSATEAVDGDESSQTLSKLDTPVYWKLLDAVQAAMATHIDPTQIDNRSGHEKAESMRPMAEQAVDSVADEQGVHLSAKARKAVINGVLDEIAGLGPLEKLVRQARIRLIQVRGAHEVKITVNDQSMPTDCQFRDDDHVLAVIQRVLEPHGKVLTPVAPALQVKLPDGASFIASIPPASPVPYITIKKSA